MELIDRAIESAQNRIYHITFHAENGTIGHVKKAERQIEVQKTTINALNKQKAVVISKPTIKSQCPCCDFFLTDSEIPAWRSELYCWNCGQKVKW